MAGRHLVGVAAAHRTTTAHRWGDQRFVLFLDLVQRQLHAAGADVNLGQQGDDVAFLARSEEHTSELQSPDHLVCRLLLEKKNREHNYLYAYMNDRHEFEAGTV